MKKEELQLLLEKYASGNCSPQEERQLENYFEHCQKNSIHLSGDTAVIGRRIYKKITSQVAVNKRKRRRALVFQIAASLLLLIGSGTYLYLLNKVEVYTEYAKSGEKKTVTLPDGSTVTLNSATRLSFTSEYNKSNRAISLLGEAYFEVIPDKERPFIVQTKDLKTKVLGTTFNINAYQENPEIIISVTSGNVNISNEKEVDEDIRKNQAISYNFLDKSHNKVQINTKDAMAWKNNVLLLNDFDLETTAGILEKWFDISIEIVDDNLKSELIHGTFKDPNLKEVLASIQFSIGIEIEYKSKNIILIKNNIQNDTN